MSMRVASEGIFGPVLCAMPFRDEDDAVRLANATPYGLTSAVWTRDPNVAMRVMRRLEAGVVLINAAGGHFVGMPFGGWKNSGLGGEECLEELLSYTQVKAVHLPAL
jgi:acyl-CoA reductase-like NAD-dependent aldehyde dehydrogenase